MSSHDALSAAQIDQFITHGFVRLDQAFSPELAGECRALLWPQLGVSEHDPSTWQEPVIRLGEQYAPPFAAAASGAKLCAALDALIGAKRWLPRMSVGTFPVRFPSERDACDCGFHVDASFGFENEPDFLAWRTNVYSRGRALLMLCLFSDVGEHDAPTRIRVGSHRSIARLLAPHGERGLSLRELSSAGAFDEDGAPHALATGAAGTVYLCHPLLVHAAQPHRGRTPRFLAQPPILPRVPLDPYRADAEPVERAIRVALLESNSAAAGGPPPTSMGV